LRLLKRIHALLYVSEGKPVSEVMAILQLSQQSVYNYVKAFILHGLDSLHYQRPSGRPPKLTKSQKQELCAVIDQGPEAAGYDCGCWTTVLLQDVILTRFGVEYHPHYLAELLGTLVYSYQKARFVSDHLAEVAAEQATTAGRKSFGSYRPLAPPLDVGKMGENATFAHIWGVIQ